MGFPPIHVSFSLGFRAKARLLFIFIYPETKHERMSKSYILQAKRTLIDLHSLKVNIDIASK